ncbi:NAD(+) diphosphatase [Microlunatus sp. GCM10028923]|uniref:NAD(+) diphosphatase n=1 Tax=Microlunatus sp. GCM10028923 TaxID=3273400 RepID=UPI00361552B4
MINWATASDLDRVEEHRRSTEWVAHLWRSPEAKLLKLDDQSRFTTNAGGSKLRLVKPFVEYDPQRHRLLGLLDDAPIFAVEALTEGDVHDFREVAHQLTDNERDVAATAAAMINWHRSEPHCPRCGRATQVINGGFARFCPVCEQEHFPRTDPAVIVAIRDPDDRLLLGGNSKWGNRISVFAGFVEAGESLEQAVHREMAEEVDVQLTDVSYFGSQPWPMPRSLMLGFSARAIGAEISIDGEEIGYADWFTRDELTAKLEAGEIALPGRSSIASRMVQAWRDDELP